MTGEPCNGKLLRTVRRGAHGKGLLVSTSPGAYPTGWGLYALVNSSAFLLS